MMNMRIDRSAVRAKRIVLHSHWNTAHSNVFMSQD